MIVRYSVANFLSFNEQIEFSMIPGAARKHAHHVVRDEAWDGINILKSAVIYGANASGKSNLIKSLAFMKQLILKGTRPNHKIDYSCFKFDTRCRQKPTRFEIEIKVRDSYYSYGFEITRAEVVSEWLYAVRKERNKMIFKRKTVNEETEVEFGRIETKDKEERQFLRFVGRGTRANQLFLTEAREKNVKQFEDVVNWFEHSLVLIFPESKYRGLEVDVETDEKKRRSFGEYLRLFNTGISDIGYKAIDYSRDLQLTKAERADLEQEIPSEGGIVIRSHDERRYMLKKGSNGEIQASELITKHKMVDTDEMAELEISFESDGTRRLLDLIPIVASLNDSDRVYVIDELDRSLHSALSYKFLQLFLQESNQQHSQLIVTTHETNLLDLELLRRDEIWFVEKDPSGASSMYSLEEFTPRYDKDIRKGYLHGRFGAVPVLGDVPD